MNTIEEAKKLITAFQSRYSAELEKMPSISEELREVCGKIEQTWSGSFTGWHGRMYFRDFQIPSIHEQFNGEWGGINGIPDGWEEKQSEEISIKIEELMGGSFSVKKFEEDIKKIREEAEKLKSELLIIFSSFIVSSLCKRRNCVRSISPCRASSRTQCAIRPR